MRIAIVTPKSWFTGSTVGGAEKQIYFISTAMAGAGHDVDLYTMDIENSFSSEGVNIIPAWNPKKGVPKLRYLTSRLPALKKKLATGSYDIVYMRGESLFAPSLVKMLTKKPTVTVVGIAAQSNLSWEHWKLSYIERTKIYDPVYYIQHKAFIDALRKVDVIAVQNDEQLVLAKAISENVVRMPSIFRASENRVEHSASESDVVWIGGLRREKGLNGLFSVIESMPKTRFTVIGKTKGKKQLYLSKKLKSFTNVQYTEYLPNGQITGVLGRSKLLLNTSPFEGFPNTFLEAWYAGVPVASLHVNPSNLLSKAELGFCALGNFDALIGYIENTISKPGSESFRRHSRKFVTENFTDEKTVEMFEYIYKRYYPLNRDRKKQP